MAALSSTRAAPRAALASPSDFRRRTALPAVPTRPLRTPSFAEVIKRGRRHASSRLTLCVLRSQSVASTEPGEGLRAGWSIQKRYLKSSVQRNAVKRQLREAVRLRKLPVEMYLVFLGRRPFLATPGDKANLKRSIRAEAETLLNRAGSRA